MEGGSPKWEQKKGQGRDHRNKVEVVGGRINTYINKTSMHLSLFLVSFLRGLDFYFQSEVFSTSFNLIC
jgi:hypothetical protein